MEEKTNDSLAGSICLSCVYCMSRIISPLACGSFQPIDDEEEISDDEQVFYHNMCLLSEEDLDFIVLECTKYNPGMDKKDAPNIFLSGKL